MTTLHFYESVFATRYRVLGVTLPPLSLWHLAALEAIESPFVTGRGNIVLGDIQMAVQVCCTRWPNRPEPRPTLWNRLQNLLWNRNERYVRTQAELLTAHLQHHQIYPDIWEEESDGKRMGSPHVLTRVVGLLELGVTLEQAWNHVSPGMSSWMMAAQAERNGSLEIMTDRQAAIMERMTKEAQRGR